MKDVGIRTGKHADGIVRLDDRIGKTFGAHHFLFAFQDIELVFVVHSMNLAKMACSIYQIQRVSLIVLVCYWTIPNECVNCIWFLLRILINFKYELEFLLQSIQSIGLILLEYTHPDIVFVQRIVLEPQADHQKMLSLIFVASVSMEFPVQIRCHLNRCYVLRK